MNWLEPILAPLRSKRQFWKEAKRRSREGRAMTRREAARRAARMRWARG